PLERQRSGGTGNMPFLTRKPIELKDCLTLLFAIIGGVVALAEYDCNAHRDFVKPLQQKQLELYEDATGAVASLATLPSHTKEWDSASNEFFRLYYGPMATLEEFKHTTDEHVITVEEAMMVVRTCLDDAGCREQKGVLQKLALGLAHTCRRSLGS